ncbi:MAG: hypothetical protein HFI40_14075 [Lachnospiraceae bacterium]|nr:hypothetical protein [Lachnospiraceae bacterium]
MRKKYQVQPATEIELEFPERTLLLRFDAAALFHAQDLEGGLSGLLQTKSPAELCTAIVYMGACEQEAGFSQEDARAIVSMLDLATVTGIIEDFTESMGQDMAAELNEVQKKTMMEFLQKLK